MARTTSRLGLLLALALLPLAAALWLKKYDENYHRPVYYNKAHRSSQHVDYNRQQLEQRDAPMQPMAKRPFDPNVHKSYYAHIMYRGSVICAGALISRRLVMTSTRCFLATELEPVQEFKAKYMKVLTGEHIGSILTAHPSQAIGFYMPTKAGNDTAHSIALIALAKKFKGSTFRYLPLHRKVPQPCEQVQMAFLDPGEYEIKLVKTKVVERERCNSTYGQLGLEIEIGKEFICVANTPKTKHKACFTRPGDPLLLNNELSAINIYGEHCDEPDDSFTVDLYFPVRYTIKFVQTATDLLRAFTGTGPFNQSIPVETIPLDANLETPDKADNKPLIINGNGNDKNVDAL